MTTLPYMLILLIVLTMALAGCDAASQRQAVTVAWATPAPEGVGDAQSQPVTDGARFYAAGSRRVAAFDVDTGRLAWTAAPLRSFAPFFPALAGGRLLVADDEAVALDAETGRELWRVPLGASGALCEHGADAATFYVGTRDRVVRALDAATGAERWRADLGSGWFGGVVTGVAVADGVAYAAVERTYPPNGFLSQGVIVALDTRTGQEIWRYENGDGSTSVSVNRAPVITSETVLIADGRGRAFLGIDRQTGRRTWEVRTEPGFVGPHQPPVVASPTGTTGYASSSDTYAYALDSSTGRVVWKQKIGHDASSPFYHAVCGDVVVHNAYRVFASDRQTGRTIGNDVYPRDTATSGFAIAGKRAFFVGERTVAALDCP